MIVYEIEKSLTGLLSALFESYVYKEVPDLVSADGCYQVKFDTVIRQIKPDEERANRVKVAVMKYSNEYTFDMVRVVLRSCSERKYTVCFNYLRGIIENRRDIAYELGSAPTVEFNDLKDKVRLEVHRFKGFLRFSETIDGYLFAKFKPDNDIIDLLAPHFMKRFKFHAFLIYDERRNRAVAYQNGKAKYLVPNKPVAVCYGREELDYRALFREYFDAVAIKSRKNEKLQRNFLPVRYRNSMTEFGGAN